MRPARAAAAGMVKIQAQTMRAVTFQRTAESRLAEPTPDIAPVITWVVLTGIPRYPPQGDIIPDVIPAINRL